MHVVLIKGGDGFFSDQIISAFHTHPSEGPIQMRCLPYELFLRSVDGELMFSYLFDVFVRMPGRIFGFGCMAPTCHWQIVTMLHFNLLFLTLYN